MTSRRFDIRDYRRLSREQRDKAWKEAIMGYIDKHQGCTKEDVIESVRLLVSRVPALALLDELIDSGIVTAADGADRRRYYLNIDKTNPLNLVPEELELFETAFFDLLDVVGKIIEEDLSDRPSQDKSLVIFQHLIEPMSIFSQLVHLVSLRAFLIWPDTIKNPEIRHKLYAMTFSKIAQIQYRFAEKFHAMSKNSNDLELKWSTLKDFRLSSPMDLGLTLGIFKSRGVEKQAKPVLDQIWNMSKDFHEYLVPGYGKPFHRDGLTFQFEDKPWEEILDQLKKDKIFIGWSFPHL